jgi:hypothetical protein
MVVVVFQVKLFDAAFHAAAGVAYARALPAT